MNWRDLPSLSALRAFEAAARLGSFSAAARELNVTHAAVAQHVRALEDHFATPLMSRTGNAMTVTPEGQPLARALTDGFGMIATASQDLMDRGSTRAIRVALTPSFATNWLMPRLARFWSAHPEVQLELIPGARMVDLRSEAVDLAIRYGRGPWPGVDQEPLVRAAHTVLGAPSRFGKRAIGNLRELAGETFLIDGLRSEETLWTRANGLDLDNEKVLTFETAQMVLEAAKAGIGIAILPMPIVASDVAEGRLTALMTESERESSIAYHIITRPGTVMPARDTFVRWLRSEAAAG